MDKTEQVDFNIVVHNLINNALISKAVSSEIVMQDNGYQMTFKVEKIVEEED